MSHSAGTVKFAPTKAFVGAIATAALALLTALGTVMTGDETLADVTQPQWVFIAIAVIASSGLTGGAVYGVTNKPIVT